jgi:hypothetical protein
MYHATQLLRRCYRCGRYRQSEAHHQSNDQQLITDRLAMPRPWIGEVGSINDSITSGTMQNEMTAPGHGVSRIQTNEITSHKYADQQLPQHYNG